MSDVNWEGWGAVLGPIAIILVAGALFGDSCGGDGPCNTGNRAYDEQCHRDLDHRQWDRP